MRHQTPADAGPSSSAPHGQAAGRRSAAESEAMPVTWLHTGHRGPKLRGDPHSSPTGQYRWESRALRAPGGHLAAPAHRWPACHAVLGQLCWRPRPPRT